MSHAPDAEADSDADVGARVTRTLESTPSDATHWSTRALGATCGMSQRAVSRVWRPSRCSRTGRDLQAVGVILVYRESRDIVGLYLHRRQALVCVWMRSRRSGARPEQPLCRCVRGRWAATHATWRHGHSLFCGAHVKSGTIMDSAIAATSLEFRSSCAHERRGSGRLDMHLILTTRDPQNASDPRWLVRHPRFHALHSTSASCDQPRQRGSQCSLKNKSGGRPPQHEQLRSRRAHYITPTTSSPSLLSGPRRRRNLASVSRFCQRSLTQDTRSSRVQLISRRCKYVLTGSQLRSAHEVSVVGIYALPLTATRPRHSFQSQGHRLDWMIGELCELESKKGRKLATVSIWGIILGLYDTPGSSDTGRQNYQVLCSSPFPWP